MAVLKEVAGQHRAYNEHNPKVLGVRQDTFINADVMRALSGRLNFNKMLFVMEVREGGQFLEWLKKDEKSSGKKTEEPTTETATEHPLLSLSDATSKTTSGSKDRSRETFKDYQVKKARWAEFLEALSAVAVADEDIVAFQHQAPEAIDPSLMFIEAEPPSKPTVKPSAKKTEVSDKSSTEKPKVTGKSSKEEAEGSKESSAKKSVSSKKAIRASDFNIIPNPGGGDCLFHALAGKNLSPRSMLRIRKTVAALRNGMPENQALNAQNVAAALFQTLSDRKARELITGRHNIPNDVYALLQAVPGIYAGEDELIQWCRLTNRRVTVVDSNGTLAIFSRGGRHPIPVTLENIHAKARRAIDGTDLALYKTPNHWERISGTNF